MEKIKVLLAEDHVLVREGTRELIQTEPDMEVVGEAGDGSEAVALATKTKPDVVIMDIAMPKLNGIEATKQIKGLLPDTAVLILTAYDDDPYVMAVLQAGANGYVLKTAKPEELIQAVRDVNEGKSALDPAITRKLMTNLFKRPQDTGVEPLTDREHEVLRLAAKGFTNKAIGVQLAISDRTVQGHLAHIFAKLQATSRTEAVMRAVSLGWITQDTGNLPSE